MVIGGKKVRVEKPRLPRRGGGKGAGVPLPAHLQILLYYGDNRNTRESPVEASRSALRSFLHYGSYHCNARNSITEDDEQVPG